MSIFRLNILYTVFLNNFYQTCDFHHLIAEKDKLGGPFFITWLKVFARTCIPGHLMFCLEIVHIAQSRLQWRSTLPSIKPFLSFYPSSNLSSWSLLVKALGDVKPWLETQLLSQWTTSNWRLILPLKTACVFLLSSVLFCNVALILSEIYLEYHPK